jgi:hypothetical protein
MISDEDLIWAHDALSRACRTGPPDDVLRSLIEFLDLTVNNDFRTQWLTRAFLAAGRLVADTHGIAHTLHAAQAFVLNPSEETELEYFNAATSTYPFGAGEGCYTLSTKKGCEPGSGCRTGAGTLEQIAIVVDPKQVLDAIAREIKPWLDGTSDPLRR